MSIVRTPEMTEAERRCRDYVALHFPDHARSLIEHADRLHGDHGPLVDFLETRVEALLKSPSATRTVGDWIDLAESLELLHAYREAQRAAPRAVAPVSGKIALPVVSAAEMSTAHLTQQTMEAMQGVAGRVVYGDEPVLPIVYDKGGEGFIVHVTSDVDEAELAAYPHDLQDVMRLAIDQNCAWIDFDRDGPIVEGLPVYDSPVNDCSPNRGP